MSKEQSNAIKFVRCHQLNKRPGDSKISIMARFEFYRDRSIVWTKRRSTTNVYISEDFPIDVSRRRNKLKPILEEASKHKQYEHCITMRGDKLLFKGELLDVDKLHTLPTEIHPRSISELRTDDVTYAHVVIYLKKYIVMSAYDEMVAENCCAKLTTKSITCFWYFVYYYSSIYRVCQKRKTF